MALALVVQTHDVDAVARKSLAQAIGQQLRRRVPAGQRRGDDRALQVADRLGRRVDGIDARCGRAGLVLVSGAQPPSATRFYLRRDTRRLWPRIRDDSDESSDCREKQGVSGAVLAGSAALQERSTTTFAPPSAALTR